MFRLNTRETLAALATCSLAFSACDSSSSNSSEGTDKSSSSESVQTVSVSEFAQLKCSEDNGGQKVLLEGTGITYTCFSIDVAGTPVWGWYPVAESEAALGNCTATENMGKAYLVPSENAVFTCAGDSWMRTDLPPTDDDNTDDDEDDGDDTEGSSSSTKTGKSSSSSVSTSKVVTFVDGIIWQPSYGKRARTFFNLVDEYNFYSPTSVTKDTSGWWEKYVDVVDGGESTAKGVFEADYLDLSITLNYVNWHTVGTGTSAYNAPDPYPYAGFQFPLSPNAGGYTDLSSWDGVCITYSSTAKFAFAVRSYKTDAGDGMHWEAAVPAAINPKTLEISFSNLTRSQYATTVVSRAAAIQQVTGFQIAYRNDEANKTCSYTSYYPSQCNSMGISASNSIKIYKIGKAGTCSASSDGSNEL